MIIIILGFIFLIVLFGFVYVLYRTNAMLERHIPSGKELPEDFGLKAEEYNFESIDGVKLFGWHFKTLNPKATIILVHGFSDPDGGKTYMLSRAKFLNQNNIDVFLFDLRSFGQSEGNFITLGIKEWMDVEAAYNLVEKIDQLDLPIGIWGNSMGAATSIIMNGKTKKGDFLVLTVPYASISHLLRPLAVREKKPYWFIKFFVELILKMKFGDVLISESPISYAGKIDVPVFIAKAKKDSKVHAGDSDILYELINSHKKLVEYDTTHDIWKEAGDNFKNDVLAFIDSSIRGN
jgi:alpha-beta hydrolase superfamily lysophospholipase